MRKATQSALAATVLVVTVVAGWRVPGQTYDYLFGRYPGSERIANEDVDLAYLSRGWVSRQSVYQTTAARDTVERWYVRRYGPISESEAHAGEHCSGFRAAKAPLHIAYAVAVSLCDLPAGTRIVVNESAFFWPAPAGDREQ